MSRSTLGQVLEPALRTFGDLVADGPNGPGIDFTETNRTHLCQARFDAFLEEPTSESFRELWSPATLAGYWMPNVGTLLGPDDEVESCEILLSEMATADTFDPAWAGRLDRTENGWGLYELFRRSRGGHEPIPTVEAKKVLTKVGYDIEDTPESTAAAIEEFADRYRDVVGHASADTEYELPIYAEIDEFFRLVQTTDRETINSQLTGPYAPLFRPLIGHRIHTDSADPLTWSGVEQLIDDHVEARDSGAYDDLETSHWGGTHIESWKWQFKDYFQDVVWDRFDLTALTADDIPALFAAIEEPDAEFDAVSNVPAKMMGGQFHRLTWGDIVDHCHENPEQAAAVLSDLFDDDVPVVDRLNEFYEFFHHLTTREENDRSPGSLLRAATALLMYAFPDRHITFQYQRMDNFFSEYSTADGLDTGFKAQQYHEVSIACQDLLDRIESRTGEASMVDVQTLIYVADDA
jgi:hypothetical protein